jgi:hypothetical protein
MGKPSLLRQPVMWLVIGLPVATVVAGIVSMVLALRSGGDDAVIDTVERTAQVQVSELGPDERAQALNLSAVLRVGNGALELLPVTGDIRRDQTLKLVLSHPSQAAQDRRLSLTPTELGWRAKADLPVDHDWLIQLTAADGSWRLRGRLPAQQRAAHLGPAITGE